MTTSPPPSFSTTASSLAAPGSSSFTSQPTQPDPLNNSSLAPSNLDTLPLLTSILMRLQPPNITNAITPSPASVAPTSQSDIFTTAQLTAKDIPTATDAIRNRLTKARSVVAQLPDLSRGLLEQEEEIKLLEDKIKMQRGVLEGLRRAGKDAVEG